MKSPNVLSFPTPKQKIKKKFFRSLFSRKKKKSELDVSGCECYILIKCAKPSSQGDMNVEMTYEGDVNLAGYLVDNASQFFAEKNSEESIHEAF